MNRITFAIALAMGTVLAGCARQETELSRVFDLDIRPPDVHIPLQAKSRLCQVHGRTLTNVIVPVWYVLPGDRGAAYYEAERMCFPNSCCRIQGGCLFMIINGRSSPTQAVASVCYACRDAEEKWVKENE